MNLKTFIILFSFAFLKYTGIFDSCYGQLVNDVIPTNIRLDPALILHDKYYVTTNTQLSATAEILSDKYKNLNLTYQWTTKNGTIVTSWKASQINYTFDKPDEDTFLKVLVVQINETQYSGLSNKAIAVRDPIVIAEPHAKMEIQHGELLDITIKFSGTGPFKFCYRMCTESFQKECDDCNPYMETDDGQVRIERYLRYVGSYILLFKVNNIASESIKHYTVKVDSTFRSQKVPYVPIVSSIVAVLTLFTGVALHMKFKKTVNMETADFEFLEIAQDEDELLEGETFCERIMYLLKRPSTYLP